jgi:hypothetical protein
MALNRLGENHNSESKRLLIFSPSGWLMADTKKRGPALAEPLFAKKAITKYI